MHHRALEKIGDRGKADVRVRPHVVLGTGLLGGRAKVIEEHERPDRTALRRGQQAPHLEATAKVLVVRLKQLGLYGGIGHRGAPWWSGFLPARSCHFGDAFAEGARGIEVALEHLGRVASDGDCVSRPP